MDAQEVEVGSSEHNLEKSRSEKSGSGKGLQGREELSHEEIKQLLPHRYPFLFIDRVIKIEPGARIVAVKNLSANENFFNGHFPGRAVMPGVLILEALAQSAGLLAKMSPGFEPEPGKEHFLVGATDVRWRRQVLPGDVLQLETKLLKKKRQIIVIAGTATVEGELAASATIQAAEVQVEP